MARVTEFNPDKEPVYNKAAMEILVQTDRFMGFSYNNMSGPHDNRLKVLFNGYVLDGYDMRYAYHQAVQAAKTMKPKRV